MDRTAHFLSKGGIVLGITAYAQSQKTDTLDRLGPALRHPVQQFTQLLTSPENVVQMATAVIAATSRSVQVFIPDWVKQLLADAELLTHIGGHISVDWPPGGSEKAPPDKEGALLGLAVAFCRNTDLARAISGLFAEPDRSLFRDAASVAAVLTAPGVPSALRRQIKQLVSAYTSQPR